MDDPMSIKASNTMSNQDDKKRVHNCNTYQNNYPRSFAYSNKQRNPVPEHNFLIMDDPMSIKASNTMSNQDDKKQVYNFNTYRNNYPRSFAYSIRHRNPVPERNFLIMDDINTMSIQDCSNADTSIQLIANSHNTMSIQDRSKASSTHLHIPSAEYRPRFFKRNKSKIIYDNDTSSSDEAPHDATYYMNLRKRNEPTTLTQIYDTKHINHKPTELIQSKNVPQGRMNRLEHVPNTNTTKTELIQSKNVPQGRMNRLEHVSNTNTTKNGLIQSTLTQMGVSTDRIPLHCPLHTQFKMTRLSNKYYCPQSDCFITSPVNYQHVHKCGHRFPMKVLVSKQPQTKGKRFYGCALPWSYQCQGYFQWL
eukprot:146480_1